MPLTNWRKVVKLAADNFACYFMEHNDQLQHLVLEAMLGCRNPDDEPEQRIYIGWHLKYSMQEDKLQCDENMLGSCIHLGSWQDDLSASERQEIEKHLSETMQAFYADLEKLGIELRQPETTG